MYVCSPGEKGAFWSSRSNPEDKNHWPAPTTASALWRNVGWFKYTKSWHQSWSMLVCDESLEIWFSEFENIWNAALTHASYPKRDIGCFGKKQSTYFLNLTVSHFAKNDSFHAAQIPQLTVAFILSLSNPTGCQHCAEQTVNIGIHRRNGLNLIGFQFYRASLFFQGHCWSEML